jgi:hypothetical protein
MLDDNDRFEWNSGPWNRDELHEYVRHAGLHHRRNLREAIVSYLSGKRGPIPPWIKGAAPLDMWLSAIDTLPDEQGHLSDDGQTFVFHT